MPEGENPAGLVAMKRFPTEPVHRLTVALEEGESDLLIGLVAVKFALAALVIEVDPSRRSAVVLNGVLLVGASVGPAMCAFAVHDSDAHGALMVSGICLAVSTAILLAVHFRSARVSPAAG